MAAVTIAKADIKIQRQSQSARDLYATWPTFKTDSSNYKNQENFEYAWRYKADGIYFDSDTGTTERYTGACTYSPPENASAVAFRVKPVAKSKSGSDSKLYTSDWSSWVYYSLSKDSVPIHDVSNLTISRSGTTLTATWRDAEYHWPEDTGIVSGYSYQWSYSNGKVFVDDASGTVTIPTDTSPSSPQVYGCTYTIPSGANEIIITVTPVAVADYLFIGAPNRKEIVIEQQERTATDITFSFNSEGNLLGFWKVPTIKLLASFDYQWAYLQDGIWNADASGNVLVSNYAKGNMPNRQWATPAYSPPSGVTKVRLRVQTVGEDGADALYNDGWTSWAEYKFTIPEKKIDSAVTATRMSNTARTFVIEWGLIDYTNVASFDYEITYRFANSYTYLKGTSGTVPVDPISRTGKISVGFEKNLSGGKKTTEVKQVNGFLWGVSYDAPENAYAFHVRVKCNPTYERAFSGSWSDDAVVVVAQQAPPKKSVDSIIVEWYNQATATLQATITMSSGYSNVASYSATWYYWHYSDEGKGAYFTGTTETVTLRSGVGVCTYQVPEEAYPKVRVVVEPVPSVTDAFTPEAKGQTFTWDIDSITIDKNTLSVGIQENTDRTMLGHWNLTGVPISQTDTIEYQWAYMIGESIPGTEDWIYDSPESVEDLAQKVTAPYDVGENIPRLAFRVRPVPISENFYIGEWSGWIYYRFRLLSRSVSNITVGLMRGSDRTMLCTWSIDNVTEVASYSYEWRYWVFRDGVNSGAWVEGSSGTATVQTPSCTYDAPASATSVAVRVIPNPEYSHSFLGVWSTYVVARVPVSDTPETPSAPTVTVEGLTLTAQVDSYDEHTSKIEFELVNETKRITSATIAITLNRATWVRSINYGTTYRVRCRGVNQDGEVGEWSQYSSDIYTAPNAPTITTCKAQSATAIHVEWNALAAAQHVTEYTVEYVIDNSSYFNTNPSAITSVTIPSGTAADILNLETAGTYYFRVKATNSQGDSAWSAIKSSILGTTPYAPTTWASTTTATTDRDIYLYWTHNSEDGSSESAAQLELTVNGTTTTTTITETHGYHLIPARTYSAGATILWRVKTKGVTNTYGPFSTQRVVDIYAAPTLGMQILNGEEENLLNGTIRKFPIILNLTAGPSTQNPVSYYVTISANTSYTGYTNIGMAVPIVKGATLYSKYISTTDASYTATIGAGEVSLEKGYSYTVTVSCSMNSGLVSTVSQIVNVEWAEEDIDLNAELEYDRKSATMIIGPYCQDEDGDIVAEARLGVYRREFDGTFTEIATNIVSSASRTYVIDPHPSLDYARYRLTAVSTLTGRTFFYDLPSFPINEKSIIIQWEETWQTFDIQSETGDPMVDRPYNGSMVKLPYNIDTDESNSIDVELINYIGRRNPVSYYGTQVGQTASWNTDVDATDMETIYALRRLSVYMGDVYVREPSGTGYWANIKVSFGRKHIDTVIPVSLEITRVEGGA